MTDYQVKKGRCFDKDIEKIHAFLLMSDCSPSTIQRIFDALYKDMTKLRTSPRIGARLSNKTSIANDYRYLRSEQYLIFYKVFDNEKLVRVYHIYHGKENYLAKLRLVD